MEEFAEIAERTPEQKIAIEARKARLLEARNQEQLDRTARARRRVIDAQATAKVLLKKKLITQNWIDRKTPEELRKFVKIACIAYQVDAISMTGSRIECLGLMLHRTQ